jgi:predicted Zn-dependent protease with MMP-like domain
METVMSTLPTLDQIEGMSIAAVAALPAEALAQLVDDLVVLVEHSRRLQAVIAAALALRSARPALLVGGGREVERWLR